MLVPFIDQHVYLSSLLDDPRIDDDVRERLTAGPISNGLFEIE